MDELEQAAQKSPYPQALASVQEARAGLDKLIHKMDGLEAGFDRIAERSCGLLRVITCFMVSLASSAVLISSF